jgi:hypothetical protein
MEECVNVATDERVHFRKLLSARYDSHFKDRVWSDIQLYHINAPQKKAVGLNSQSISDLTLTRSTSLWLRCGSNFRTPLSNLYLTKVSTLLPGR